MTALRLALALFVLGTGCADTHPSGYTSDHDRIQVVSASVGANVYIPSTLTVVAGKPYTLSVYNATEQPHGFAIEGLGIEVVLPPQQETEVPLPALEGGKVYRLHCQLHGAHRGATLVVLERD